MCALVLIQCDHRHVNIDQGRHSELALLGSQPHVCSTSRCDGIASPRACLPPTAINRMPFFAHASGCTIKGGHMYDVAGDYVNINLAMPAESTGWFGISMFQ